MDINLKRRNPALNEDTKGEWLKWLEDTINIIKKDQGDIDDVDEDECNPKRIFGTERKDTDEILDTFTTIFNTLKENTLTPVAKTVSL